MQHEQKLELANAIIKKSFPEQSAEDFIDDVDLLNDMQTEEEITTYVNFLVKEELDDVEDLSEDFDDIEEFEPEAFDLDEDPDFEDDFDEDDDY